jgi:hypothetical protein
MTKIYENKLFILMLLYPDAINGTKKFNFLFSMIHDDCAIF